MEGVLTMSQKEVDRVGVLQQVVERRILQREAATRRGLHVRQIKRLLVRFRGESTQGLLSRRRGKRPNTAFASALRQEILDLVRRAYADFGPTLAAGKLAERHGPVWSAETLRQWMQAEGLWTVPARRKVSIHPRRPRRPCRGERVQIDGSPHPWLEGRGPRCTLIVFIDDATGAWLALRLSPAERRLRPIGKPSGQSKKLVPTASSQNQLDQKTP
jgi:transposase